MVFGTNALQLIETVKRRKKSKIDLKPVLVAGEPQPVGLHGAAAEPSHHIHCPFSSGFYFIKYFALFFLKMFFQRKLSLTLSFQPYPLIGDYAMIANNLNLRNMS